MKVKGARKKENAKPQTNSGQFRMLSEQLRCCWDEVWKKMLGLTFRFQLDSTFLLRSTVYCFYIELSDLLGILDIAPEAWQCSWPFKSCIWGNSRNLPSKLMNYLTGLNHVHSLWPRNVSSFQVISPHVSNLYRAVFKVPQWWQSP